MVMDYMNVSRLMYVTSMRTSPKLSGWNSLGPNIHEPLSLFLLSLAFCNKHSICTQIHSVESASAKTQNPCLF